MNTLASSGPLDLSVSNRLSSFVLGSYFFPSGVLSEVGAEVSGTVDGGIERFSTEGSEVDLFCSIYAGP